MRTPAQPLTAPFYDGGLDGVGAWRAAQTASGRRCYVPESPAKEPAHVPNADQAPASPLSHKAGAPEDYLRASLSASALGDKGNTLRIIREAPRDLESLGCFLP